MNSLVKKISSILIVGILNFLVLINVSEASSNLHLSGKDRYDTNIKIIDEAVKLGAKTGTVVIVSGKDYPDALSAGNIAYREKFPLILEDSSLEQKVAKYNPTNVIVVGGKNTVVKDSSLEQRLKGKYGFKRLAGADRYKTSDAVINYIEGLSSIAKYDKVGVRGNDFPDALSAIPLASKSGSLLRLSNNSNNQFYITVGGRVPGKIVASSLGDTGRNISGRDRYGTSQKVVEVFKTDKLLVVKGNDYPDALAASTLAGVLNANILLVNTNGLTNEDIRLINAANDVIYIGGGVPIYNPNGATATEPTEPESEAQVGSTEEKIEQYRKEVFRLVNIERKKVGLANFEWREDFSKGMQVRAEELSREFSHSRPDGSSIFTAFEGLDFYSLGENIAVGQGTPQAVVDAWMNSEGHKANILHPYAEGMNVGYYHTSNIPNGHYWALVIIVNN
ncbi:MAG: cell wall-binding repeat-containing protein [Miniphocaeibacter sp.]|uniref:cell wall-binding repeat-containing protein n=1 Tax=Miniphocaeibacter sp. TaxID=3100973 RepID=UPI0018104517|nr:hypothetical protein [Gallicola sp.]